MTTEKRLFGHTEGGERVDCYTLADGNLRAEILNYGGTIRSLVIEAADGARDVALGFDDVAAYEAQACYIGAIVGRVANRIENACFALNGKNYYLGANNGRNCLHSGPAGFDRRIWDVQTGDGALVLTLRDPDETGGFPGNLDVEVCYRLGRSRLSIEYTAKCDEDTPLNLTSHCYFNLGGHGSGGVEKHSISIFADYITPISETLIPTGELLDVTHTPFDMRERTRIGNGLSSSHPQIILGAGYDHNFVLSRKPQNTLSRAAVLEYDGLTLQCLTTQPGIQLYSGNFLSGEVGKGGAVYGRRSGLCLEAQGWPNAVNTQGFPDSTLRKGETYSHKTEYALFETNAYQEPALET